MLQHVLHRLIEISLFFGLVVGSGQQIPGLCMYKTCGEKARQTRPTQQQQQQLRDPVSGGGNFLGHRHHLKLRNRNKLSSRPCYVKSECFPDTLNVS